MSQRTTHETARTVPKTSQLVIMCISRDAESGIMGLQQGFSRK